ncbi:kinetochore complex Sim4 subunit Fta1-domain-containing protein [Hypomontagnella monticulosa]|nr:kinetochore complex Sim4 subunit Fta1-domain-containing protein [Hypomontagnella monticulosa]
MPPRRRKRNEATAGPAAEQASPSPSPSPAPEPSPEGSRSASLSADSSQADSEPPRFLNTTFTTYRVSPLYVGTQPLSPTRLAVLSRRLRDMLVGDVVRGVQVGLESDAALGRTGALIAVEWRWIGVKRILGPNTRDGGRDGSVELGNSSDVGEAETETEDWTQRKGHVLCIELRYENARFSALLLPDLGGGSGVGDPSSNPILLPSWTWQNSSRAGDVDTTTFMSLPLLLFRMPAPLKAVLIDFLSNTFDCRINPLALGTRTLVHSWEAWLSHANSRDRRRTLSRDVLITLGFHVEPPDPKPKPTQNNSTGDGDPSKEAQAQAQAQTQEPPHLGLKSVDITIPAGDIRRFLRVGSSLASNPTAATRKRKAVATTTLSAEQQSRQRRKLAGGKEEEGWAWQSQNESNNSNIAEVSGKEKGGEEEETRQPFTEALAAYLWHHLGLDVFHPGVRVQRVACDGFALSDGRLKIFAPTGRGESDSGSVWKLMRDLVRRARGKPEWGVDALGMGMEGVALR